MSLLRSIYGAAMVPLSLIAAPFFALHPRGKLLLKERYGCWSLPPGEYLWFHSASLGEMQGLIPIIKFIKERYPAIRLLATSTSPTGLDPVRGMVAEVRLLPFDSPMWITRAISGVSFTGFVFGETELWPVLIENLKERGIPTCLVNARISDATAHLYSSLQGLFGATVRALSRICCSDGQSLERFKALGAAPNIVNLCGNAKYDRKPIIPTSDLATEVRSIFIEGTEPVFTLASIHPEEWALWVDVLREFVGKGVRIIVAPRHSEKFQYFANALQRAGIYFQKRSELKAARTVATSQFLLLDTFGELESVYSFSTGAFLGGTIRDIGGHNPLEGAMYGVALCAGPSRWNIRDIAAALCAAGSLVDVATTSDARAFVTNLVDAPGKVRERGLKGRAVWESNLGATERVISCLKSLKVLPA